ncbi:hypothetical protein LTR47_007569 [Exophiala xenobiotica]|nr:hypothetical protein LTR72_004923 [Exophiala xenobiotica]KAK5230427.1 hypothetical protein LTR47_007569 [Exophiala xenobiotica]KAK5245552.1 hypothetical protein LTS06_009019 [Exophiala xenobiotica]KAK5286377.1 hypothetical protein LTR14_010045 [Exophiala xenobiotica]KAK5346227.1 hypothetical protein LTR61_010093 [Exophiala xenobiotica]
MKDNLKNDECAPISPSLPSSTSGTDTQTPTNARTSSGTSIPDMAGAPSPSFDPPITFSTVIDSDHNTINRFAGHLKRARTSADRVHLLREVTWRLVRHDVSEDIVMRPAFVAHLGDEGERMAEHDRTDHDRAKIELLALFGTGQPDAPDFMQRIDRLFAELLEHMRTESGDQIPALERMLDPLESQRLGREYMKTQVLAPDLVLSDEHSGQMRRVWRDVEEYARTDLARFRDIYERVTKELYPTTTTTGYGRGKL